MSLREWVNNNSMVGTILAVVVLAVALGVVALQFRGPGPGTETQVYFWDMETGELFAGGANEAPPIEAPSGGEGVRAHLFSCGACTPEEWFGYLERHTEEARRLQEDRTVRPDDPDVRAFLQENHLIRELGEDRWVSMTSSAGQRIQREVRERCGGERPTLCMP